MPILHIANVFFELELARQLPASFPAKFSASPVGRQLQYLPFLYADAQDGVVCDPAPDAGRPYFEAQPEPLGASGLLGRQVCDGAWDGVEVWGWSPSIYHFLETQGIAFTAPSEAAVKRVNRKDWAFRLSPQLEGAQLISDATQLRTWLKNTRYPAVLKTVYGVSGRGHRIYQAPSSDCEDFARQEWERQRPVIGEPWMSRSQDYSSQWQLEPDGKARLLAWTLMENDARGSYAATCIGLTKPPLFEQHQAAALHLLQHVHREGYFGPLGIDAFTYDEGRRLHPICELNARHTMAGVALRFRDKHFPGCALRMSYGPRGAGLLPAARSPRQLRFEVIT